MNERIKELYRETTGKDWVYDFDPDYAEKFAELIIRECFSKLEPYLNDQFINDIESELKEHFGVKE